MNRRKLIRQLKAGKNEIVLDTPEAMQLFDSKDWELFDTLSLWQLKAQ